MDSNRLPTSTIFLVIITLSISILIQSPLLLSQQENHEYETCKESFQCANIENISYPFWGGSRPGFCGHPGFRLSCEVDVPVLTIVSVPYRVLNLDSTANTLTVARQDLWSNPCPRNYLNTTLDTNLFDYVDSDLNVTLHYGCTANLGQTGLSNRFNCPSNVISTFYFTTSEMPDFNVSWLVTCSDKIIIPVNEISYGALSRSAATVFDLEAAFASGFGLQYLVANCSQCVQSNGLCGHNLTTNSFTCYCEDGSRSLTCGNNENRTANSSQKKSTRNIVVSAVGASLGVIVIVSLFFFCKQRKQLAAQGAQTKSEEFPTIHVSRSQIASPSATFTRSIPFYPSSKSILGKGSNYFGAQVFSYTELEQATANFDSSRELGDGGFGTVYYGKLNDGRIVAVKRHYDNNFKRVEQFMNEVQILTRLRHHNLVTLYGCTSRRSRELLLVYEYIPNGTVADHLHGKRAKSGLLSWPIRMSIAVETAEALAYLHRSDVIHRDVKTTNILLDNDFHVKVADFGLSRFFPNDATHVSTAPQGTPGYVDPEYFKSYKLTEKSDVYSFGVVLIELISSLEAVDIDRHEQDINLFNMAIGKIQNNALHELVDPSIGFTPDSSVRRMISSVAQLAFRCLQVERDMRPSMNEVLETLRVVQNEEVLNAQKEQMFDVLVDDAVPLKDNIAIPVSPDSVIPEDWHSSSTTHSSSRAVVRC